MIIGKKRNLNAKKISSNIHFHLNLLQFQVCQSVYNSLFSCVMVVFAQMKNIFIKFMFIHTKYSVLSVVHLENQFSIAPFMWN